ncbi:MAG: ATP citrate lyase citrate-binding domain-containing protein [Dethiobacteria bacterium]|jgi:ATP citrate (pro-S)-lyase
MAQKAIREAQGKKMLARLLKDYDGRKYTVEDNFISVGPETDLNALTREYPWLESTKVVVKPDQLIKMRGKNGLLRLNAGWNEAREWITEKMGNEITIDGVTGLLDHFIVEPYVKHDQDDEYYVAITSVREGDNILFYHRGGVDVGDVDEKAEKMLVPIGSFPSAGDIEKNLLGYLNEERKSIVAGFMEVLFRLYADCHFAYLEINPLVVVGDRVHILDLAARLDSTADFLCKAKWDGIEFPSPFGRVLTEDEAYIEELDSKTGSSLKLTILNPKGRVWTMVAGGGASVIYADTITDLGYMDEMANYGEYSGDPNEEFTYKYARTILDCMTREKDPRGKFLLIGGAIANFTDVASTFKGIIRALKEYRQKLIDNKVKIFVRRGGPNYKEGLRQMKELGQSLGVPIEVYGPEAHMTKIVKLALKGSN